MLLAGTATFTPESSAAASATSCSPSLPGMRRGLGNGVPAEHRDGSGCVAADFRSPCIQGLPAGGSIHLNWVTVHDAGQLGLTGPEGPSDVFCRPAEDNRMISRQP